jgi:hypothetical protein
MFDDSNKFSNPAESPLNRLLPGFESNTTEELQPTTDRGHFTEGIPTTLQGYLNREDTSELLDLLKEWPSNYFFVISGLIFARREDIANVIINEFGKEDISQTKIDYVTAFTAHYLSTTADQDTTIEFMDKVFRKFSDYYSEAAFNAEQEKYSAARDLFREGVLANSKKE